MITMKSLVMAVLAMVVLSACAGTVVDDASAPVGATPEETVLVQPELAPQEAAQALSRGPVGPVGVSPLPATHCVIDTDCVPTTVSGGCTRGVCDTNGTEAVPGQPVGCTFLDAPAMTECSTAAGCTGACTGPSGVGCVVTQPFPADCGTCVTNVDCGVAGICKGGVCNE